jgi:hypothetical protein
LWNFDLNQDCSRFAGSSETSRLGIRGRGAEAFERGTEKAAGR